MAAIYLLALITLPHAVALVHGPWSDQSMSPGERATLLLNNMSLHEKMAMLHGPTDCFANSPTDSSNLTDSSGACPYDGNVPANTRLDIPPLHMNYGPLGFRDDLKWRTTTCWPSGLNMAASWDKSALYEWGAGMAREFFEKGANVLLGPGVNVARIPYAGRSFESITGEDPVLGFKLVQPAIKGIQSQKVMANVRHWVLNSQETNRGSLNEKADERTRMEIYYPPFAGAIKAGAVSFMCSYNKIHGKYSCEQPETLNHDLRKSLEFKGFVISDRDAARSASIQQGLDMEMGAEYMNEGNLQMQSSKSIDTSVHRILYGMFKVGIMDAPMAAWDVRHHNRNVSTTKAAASARKLAALSTVLLKNEGGILPLEKGKRLALIGFGTGGAIIHGLGSSSVEGSYPVPPLEGIRAAAGPFALIDWSDGTDLSAAAAMAKGADVALVFVGTLSTEGQDRKSLSLDDGCRVVTVPPIKVSNGGHSGNSSNSSNDSNSSNISNISTSSDSSKTSYSRANNSNSTNSSNASNSTGNDSNSTDNSSNGSNISSYNSSDNTSTGNISMNISYNDSQGAPLPPQGIQCQGNAHQQNALVEAVARANPKTVVVASVPGPIVMPWSKAVQAILVNFLPGQEAGNAIADVLFGKVNPSARLPVTFPNKENETQLSEEQYPGVVDKSDPEQPMLVNYSEKFLVGYRYYDEHRIRFTTGFPFGHGLSYTTFEYSGLTFTKLKISFTVANTGQVPGAEVAQLYLGFPLVAEEPPLQLKGFQKTRVLEPGANQTVVIRLTKRELSMYNMTKQTWWPVLGYFRVYIGSSSRDIRLQGTLQYGHLPHEYQLVNVLEQSKSSQQVCTFDGKCGTA